MCLLTLRQGENQADGTGFPALGFALVTLPRPKIRVSQDRAADRNISHRSLALPQSADQVRA